MPTSSIFHNFIIADPDDVNRFISAIENKNTPRQKIPGKLITDRNEIAALMIRNKKRRNILGGNIMNKTELALKHFEESVLSSLLFRLFSEDDAEFILLKNYLPHTLNELKCSKDADSIKFLKLLEEYDWEINATEEERDWREIDDVGRVGKFLRCSSYKGPQLVRNEWALLNGAEEDSDADYTVFITFEEGTEYQITDINYTYTIEFIFYEEDDDEDELVDDMPDEIPYEITGLGMRIYDTTDYCDDIVAYPFNTACVLDNGEVKLANKEQQKG